MDREVCSGEQVHGRAHGKTRHTAVPQRRCAIGFVLPSARLLRYDVRLPVRAALCWKEEVMWEAKPVGLASGPTGLSVSCLHQVDRECGKLALLATLLSSSHTHAKGLKDHVPNERTTLLPVALCCPVRDLRRRRHAVLSARVCEPTLKPRLQRVSMISTTARSIHRPTARCLTILHCRYKWPDKHTEYESNRCVDLAAALCSGGARLWRLCTRRGQCLTTATRCRASARGRTGTRDGG